MKQHFNEIEHIEAYLGGGMDEATRRSFEAQLASDGALRKEVAAYRQIFSGFQSLKEDAFAADVAAWTKAAKASKPAVVKPIQQQGAAIRTMWVRRLAVAAGVALLLAAAGAWWQARQHSTASLVAQSYSPPMANRTMGKDQQADAMERLFSEGHELFKNGNYEGAAQKFRNLLQGLDNSPNTDRLTKKFYTDNARWTLLLAQFASGQLPEDKMLQILDIMASDPASEYAGKAKELREDLGSFWRKFAK